MKRFRNILYILDEISLARQGSADKVEELARLNDAKITVLVAGETNLFEEVSQRITGQYEKIHQAIIDHNREQLDSYISNERWQGVDIVPDYSEASDFISIIRKVIRNRHDLVIKEASLEKGIDQLSMRLVRKCPCPVWVFKYDPTDFKRILAAIDVGSTHAETAALNKKVVELTHSLAQREGGEANYLHSWRLEYESMLRSPRLKVSSQEISEIKLNLLRGRQAEMAKLLTENHIHYTDSQIHIREGISSTVIQQAIKEFNIDVVVMGSVGRSGIPGLLIGNKAEQLLSTISCSVLTVKPDGFKSPVTLD